MADNDSFDLVVIGGGPAGYVGAIRAAQLGLKVACVERDALGGVCLNWGCIPTKALLAGAELYVRLRHEAADWGILADNVRHDWSRVIARSRGVAGNLNRGIAGLFRKHGVTHLEGRAVVSGRDRVRVVEDGGAARDLATRNVLVATGARPRTLPGVAFDGERVIHSRHAMSLATQPKRLLIIGAGAIGMEFAYFYHAYGTEVVIVEMLDHLLPVEDEEVSRAMEKAWRKLKIETHTATKTLDVQSGDDGVTLTLAPVTDPGATRTVTGDAVLVAIGVEGSFDDLFDGVSVEVEKGHIRVDRSTYQSSVPGIFAAGDVIGPPWLAHVASEEAIVCVERIAGHDPTPIDYEAIPGCTYCQPQVASLGLTERACRDQGIEYRVGKFPFQASGKAQAIGATQGFVKIIASAAHDEILGAHMVGESVTELLAELGLARRLEATASEVIATMHAHPTLSEAVHEAALGVRGEMIHF
ncbi:MAG: dihydrolipoyl dehydrogenase [Phycisphaeraceae bacterium]|nr:dihydrolipoyl dehydrogenase [Phycisphaeraceae bacterium]